MAAGLGSVFRLPAFLGSYPYAALRWCELGSAVPPKVENDKPNLQSHGLSPCWNTVGCGCGSLGDTSISEVASVSISGKIRKPAEA